MNDLAGRLRRLREQRGWSLSELARRAGLSKTAVLNIERGSSDPALSSLQQLAGALGIKLAELLGDEDPLPARAMSVAPVLSEVAAERSHQVLSWGDEDMFRGEELLLVIGAAMGQANDAAVKALTINRVGDDEARWRVWMRRLRQELIQVAAVAVAAVESLDRNELRRNELLDPRPPDYTRPVAGKE